MPVDTSELMNAVFTARPVDFDKGMSDQIQDRVTQLVADRKLEVAQSFFGPKDATVEISDEDPDEFSNAEDDSDEDDNEETPEEESEPEVEDDE
jgi:hypothetical protein